MTYILNNVSLNNIIEITLSIIISSFFAFIIWIIKNSYENRRTLLQVIAEIERSQVQNEKIISDYIDSLKQWVEAIKDKKLYIGNFSHMRLVDHEKTALLEVKFVNDYLRVAFKLIRLEEDVVKVYDYYFSFVNNTIKSGFLEKEKIDDYEQFLESTSETVTVLLSNSEIIKEDLFKNIAYTQLLFRQKKFSIFGLFSKLNISIYPLITDKDIEKQVNKIKKEQKEKQNIKK